MDEILLKYHLKRYLKALQELDKTKDLCVTYLAQQNGDSKRRQTEKNENDNYVWVLKWDFNTHLNRCKKLWKSFLLTAPKELKDSKNIGKGKITGWKEKKQ